MANANLSPVPYQAPLTGSQGLLSSAWAGWFRQLFQTVITASQVDATVAAANAQAAASAASSSAGVANSNAQSAASFAAQSANSATASAQSASSAAQASTDAVQAASAAQTLANQLGAGAVSPDYIDVTFNVPAHRQLLTFQRVTLAPGGSLRISGRGRIL